jgi:hypothetical protein
MDVMVVAVSPVLVGMVKVTVVGNVNVVINGL